jgi:hypothetical protein
MLAATAAAAARAIPIEVRRMASPFADRSGYWARSAEKKHRTANIEHRTSKYGNRYLHFEVRCSVFDVRCFRFFALPCLVFFAASTAHTNPTRGASPAAKRAAGSR